MKFSIPYLLENPKGKELKAILDYIGDFAEGGDKAIKTENGNFSGYIYKESNRWKRFSIANGNKNAFFSADSPRFLIFEKEKIFKELSQNQDWYPVANGFYWVVYESKNKTSPPYPLRFGIDDNEEKILLNVSRQAIAKFLENGEIVELNKLTMSPRFFYKNDLDVSIWMAGQLRGSAVITERNVAEGVIEASLAAIRDQRFKPVSLEELPKTRIEITIFSNFRTILDKNFIRKNKIIFDKGYHLILGKKEGWFLPEVFNVRRFSDLNNFLGDLAQEKARLPREIYRSNKAKIEIFDVIDFIEGERLEEVFDLRGPIITPKINSGEVDNLSNLENNLRQAGDWLLKMQENDGNFVPIINPLNGTTTQIDWPRSILSAWSLSELSKITKERRYLEAAQNYFNFLSAYHVYLKDRNFDLFRSSLIFAYAGDLVLSFPKENPEYFREYSEIANYFLSNKDRITYADPITAQQVLSFLSALVIMQKSEQKIVSAEMLEMIGILSKKLENDFDIKSKQPDCNLAVWAELVHSFNNLFLAFGDEADKEFVFKLADWLVKFQNDDGSFWGTTNDPNFVYTRGTAKIFEVLPDALELAIKMKDESRMEKYKTAIGKCLTWLETMQYDENNVFFVRPEIREKIIGGFRHDYFNQEAWIDAAAHFILGGVRLVKLMLNQNNKTT